MKLGPYLAEKRPTLSSNELVYKGLWKPNSLKFDYVVCKYTLRRYV